VRSQLQAVLVGPRDGIIGAPGDPPPA